MITLEDAAPKEGSGGGNGSQGNVLPPVDDKLRGHPPRTGDRSTECGSRPRSLFKRLFKWWRAGATGLGFATFMVGSLFLALGPFQILRLRRLPALERNLRFLRLMHRSFALFMRYLSWLGVMKPLVIEGREHLRPGTPCLYVANHPTLLDVVALISLLPSANCIVKKSLWNHFYLGGVVKAAGFIPNDHARQLIEDCGENFRLGKSLIVFPEGTRSPAKGLRAFNRGAAQIALRTGVALQPVIITCEPPTLMKNQAWYDVPEEPFQLKLCIGPILAVPDEIAAMTDPPRQARELTRHMQHYFEVAILPA